LVPDNALSDFADGPEMAWKRVANLDLRSAPGEKFVYSDVGFLILGHLVERVSGMPLDRFAAENIFQPLGMTDSRFPGEGETDEKRRERTAPTEKVDGEDLRGIVHDPRSRALGGVAGHAGLFSTADDLAIFANMMLNQGRGASGQVILKPETVAAMIDPGSTPERQRRGLGWDVDTPFSAPRGKGFGLRSFGHTGFTGTSLWLDPETESFVIVLASRLHPSGSSGSTNPLRAAVATAAAEAIVRPVGAPVPEPAP
jgi:CubicO group peptidase (beta-lactamase class C family)